MLDRGDFENLAAAIADSDVLEDQNYTEAEERIALRAKRTVAFDLADSLTTTSTRFDPVLWLRQCEVGPVSADDVAVWTKRLNSRVAAIRQKRSAYEARTGESLGEY